MTSAWQSCQGDYKPEQQFQRGNQTVIVRNLVEVEDGLWQWEEYAMLTEDFDIISTLISENEPYKETKTAYIGDKSVEFKNLPKGNVSVFIVDSEGNHPDYQIQTQIDRTIVSFEALEYVAKITIVIS